MTPRATLTAVACAVPGLALAVVGLFHPHHLTYDTSQRWYAIHLPGLVAFPLVGAALAWTVRGRRDATSWLIRLAAYVYAVFYSALDVISGIAAGYVTHHLGPGVPRTDSVRLLFRIGTPLGRVGSVALMCLAVLVVLDAVVDVGLLAAPTLVLLPGALLVHTDHIFSPRGVLGMALLGVGTASVVVARHLAGRRGNRRARDATSVVLAAS